ncbi:MAG: hypothetical protein R6V19_07770, partial [Armatimonadota bacterium]
LADDTELNPEVIRERHADEWVDFQAWRVAKLCAKMREAIHEIAPGTEFYLYSGYQTPDNPLRYGIDWEYVGQMRACDVAEAGYGRPAEAVRETVRVLDGIPLVCGVLVIPHSVNELQPVRPLTRAVLLRRMLDSTGGILMYTRMEMDGRSLLAVSDISRLVADYEELFLQSELQPLGDADPASVQVLRGDGATLVCVMNTGTKAYSQALTLPGDAGGGREYYTGEAVKTGQEVTCSLEPGEVAVYVLEE